MAEIVDRTWVSLADVLLRATRGERRHVIVPLRPEDVSEDVWGKWSQRNVDDVACVLTAVVHALRYGETRAPLPVDAAVVGFWFDVARNELRVLLSSPVFDVVQPGMCPYYMVVARS